MFFFVLFLFLEFFSRFFLQWFLHLVACFSCQWWVFVDPSLGILSKRLHFDPKRQGHPDWPHQKSLLQPVSGLEAGETWETLHCRPRKSQVCFRFAPKGRRVSKQKEGWWRNEEGPEKRPANGVEKLRKKVIETWFQTLPGKKLVVLGSSSLSKTRMFISKQIRLNLKARPFLRVRIRET